MLWLPIIVSAYFIFAVNNLIDNFLLLGPPNPKSYSFYVGTLGILVLLLIPFVNFSVPETNQIILALVAGVLYVLALFSLFYSLEYYEPSRVVPAIGAILPLCTFGLVYFFSNEEVFLGIKEILAFSALILGSFLISFSKKQKISFQSFKIAALAGFLFSLTFFLSKYVYLAQPFWSGFIWMRIGSFLAGICFLITKEVREEIFQRKFTFEKKTGALFLLNQGAGAGGFILQNFAISLAGLIYLPFINALQGLQYVFLFLLVFFLTKKFPRISEEKFTKEIIIQKGVSIGLIVLGLIIFYF